MKKSDLKPGMRVKLRNGWVYIYCIMGDKHLLIRQTSYTFLNSYSETLEHISGDKNLDIMEVYGIPNLTVEYFLHLNKPYIWKREEQVTLTFQEIADMFNIPVESLRIKK